MFKKWTKHKCKGQRTEDCNFIKKETLAQVFSCEFCEISKNTFFTEHLRATASALYHNSLKETCQEKTKNFRYPIMYFLPEDQDNFRFFVTNHSPVLPNKIIASFIFNFNSVSHCYYSTHFIKGTLMQIWKSPHIF